MSSLPKVKFGTEQVDRQFHQLLTKRVNRYFKLNNITKQANANMVFKTIFMYLLYFTPFVLMLTGVATGWLGWTIGYVLMGWGVAGIGLSVMHDANHGSYSKYPWVNKMLGLSLNLVGGAAFTWKVQHNVLHHTYTNVYDMDEDISPRGLFRFSPDSKFRKIHRFQHLYAWFFYGALTLSWVIAKDFNRLHRYHKLGLIEKQKTTYGRELAVIIISKVVYFTYVIGLPLLFTDFSIGQIILGFVVMHYIAGMILALIFQPAHVEESTEFFQPNDDGKLPSAWAVHQLFTTSNFAMRSRLFTWFIGGLNYQVEHHLFPNICHVHYRKLSKIVRKTAKEFDLPYKSRPTFAHALWYHAKLLYQLGHPQAVPVPAK
ncbi:MAG TPA: acyl-CoA desaturase [Cytophagales bacterium]|nr:acyl-CoA desaturase [Cytophagales bacterium]HAA21172.1 acyl-CoA desaturase [Cytophagales bacterium]HAP60692.1 acyl-CoA desaturase [Cytophagales bacterium]